MKLDPGGEVEISMFQIYIYGILNADIWISGVAMWNVECEM